MKRILTLAMMVGLTITSCTEKITPTPTTPTKSESSDVEVEHDFQSFEGTYATRPNEDLKVYQEGNDLKIQGGNKPVMDLIPTTSKNRFFLKEFNVHVEFVSNGLEITKLLMIRGDGQRLEAPRIG